MAEKNKKITYKILNIIAITGLITVTSLFAPQLPYLLLRALIKRRLHQNINNEQIGNTVRYLKRKKFIAFEKHNSKWKLIITKLGKKHLKKRKIDNIQIKKTKWDGKWRLVTFDIPEKHKTIRHIFRRKLVELGFFHFQRSVFIIPYPCEQEINKILNYYQVHPYVHILTSERFSNDKKLVKLFKLN